MAHPPGRFILVVAMKLISIKVLAIILTVSVMLISALVIFPMLANGPFRELLIVTSPYWRKPFSPVYELR